MTCDVLEPRHLGRFHHDYYRRNRPVILRGLAEASGLRIFSWSAEYFADILGHQEVPVVATTTGFLSYERNVRRMPYREFFERSFRQEAPQQERYYFKNPTSILPAGHDDSDGIEALAPYMRRSIVSNLWISAGGLTVGLHFDHADNLNLQLRGRKIFMLYPPGVAEYYPMPMFSQTAHISRVFRDGPNPDYQKFPRFDAATGLRIELQEGDILYLPAYWWHQVESLGAQNVNLNFWWLPPVKKQIVNWNQAVRGYYQLLSRYVQHGSILKAPSEDGSRAK